MDNLHNADQMTRGRNMQSNPGVFTTLGTFFLGSLLGAVAGILLAPRSGQETIEKTKQKAQATLGKGKDKVDDVLDRTKDTVEQTGEIVSQASKDAKQVMSNIKAEQSKPNSR